MVTEFNNFIKLINELKDEYYTFDDLVFLPSFDYISSLEDLKNAKRAYLKFPNEYAVSVVFGKIYYSNGIDTYELMGISPDRSFYHDGPLRYITKEQVTEEMIKLQKLKPYVRKFTPEDPFGEEDWEA